MEIKLKIIFNGLRHVGILRKNLAITEMYDEIIISCINLLNTKRFLFCFRSVSSNVPEKFYFDRHFRGFIGCLGVVVKEESGAKPQGKVSY